MLILVFSHGYITGLVNQDVGCLEHRVVEQPHIDVFAVLLCLLLELSHSLQISNGGQAVEYPGKFQVFWDVGLDKEGALVPGQTTGNIDQGRVQNLLLHQERLVFYGDGMVVDNAVNAVIVFGQFHPVLDGSEVVPNMNFACGLNSTENPFHFPLHPDHASPTRAVEAKRPPSV